MRSQPIIGLALLWVPSALGQCPPPPEAVGASRDRCAITITWSPVLLEATGYQVWRNTSGPNPAGASLVATINGAENTSHVDEPPVYVADVYYFVRSIVDEPPPSCPGGVGPFSSPSAGMRAEPPPPSGFTASAGGFPNGIDLHWDPVPDAVTYPLFRHVPAGGVDYLGEIAATTYFDSTAPADVVVTYSIYSFGPCGVSASASMAAGFTGSAPYISAQSGSLVVESAAAAELWVQTPSIPSPTHYKWYRDAVPVVAGPRINGIHAPTLSISPVRLEDVGVYTCTVTVGSDSVTSAPIVLAVRQTCRADFDESGGAPAVTDIFAFLSAWFAGCP